MTLYVILFFIALLIGMAVSVYAFGTGSKRAKIFKEIYYSIEDVGGMGILYTKTGEYSAVLRFKNPCQKYCANIDSYYEFAHLITALAQTLGEGYALHKQDVFIRKGFNEDDGKKREFLSDAYFRYFKGREYTDGYTYLTITQENRKSKLMSYDPKKWNDFISKLRKVKDRLRDAGIDAEWLSKQEASDFVDRFFALNFSDKVVSMDNLKVDDERISMGDKWAKVYSLIDIDSATVPGQIRPYTDIEVNNTSMPVDLMSIVDSIPEAETVIFNQMIYIPNQKKELSKLERMNPAVAEYSVQLNYLQLMLDLPSRTSRRFRT